MPVRAAREAAAGLARMLGGPVTAAGECVADGSATVGPARSARPAWRPLIARPGTRCRRCSHSAGTARARSMAELGFVGVLLSAGDTGRRFITDTLGPVLDYDAPAGRIWRPPLTPGSVRAAISAGPPACCTCTRTPSGSGCPGWQTARPRLVEPGPGAADPAGVAVARVGHGRGDAGLPAPPPPAAHPPADGGDAARREVHHQHEQQPEHEHRLAERHPQHGGQLGDGLRRWTAPATCCPAARTAPHR